MTLSLTHNVPLVMKVYPILFLAVALVAAEGNAHGAKKTHKKTHHKGNKTISTPQSGSLIAVPEVYTFPTPVLTTASSTVPSGPAATIVPPPSSLATTISTALTTQVPPTDSLVYLTESSTDISTSSSPATSIYTIVATTTAVLGSTSFEPAHAPQPTHTPDFQSCYKFGGVKDDGTVYTGCGGLLAHTSTCYEASAPWTDPYDEGQSMDFRGCLCETSADTPFTPDSTFYQNFSQCAHCLTLARPSNYNYMAQQLQRIDNFCRSQNPSAFLFIKQLRGWLAGLDRGMKVNGLVIPDVTPMVSQLQPLYTTTPPLANLAYGPSAPWDGSLVGVTPSMTTFTTTAASGTATVTSLVTWLPTEAGKTFNGAAAADSAAEAASSALGSEMGTSSSGSKTRTDHRCYGRGPCHTDAKNAAAIGKVPEKVLLVGNAIALAGAVI